MTVTTRSVAKRNYFNEQIKILNDYEYRPLDGNSNLSNDEGYQQVFFEPLFTYDFSEWPKTCWLEPKFQTTDFQMLIDTLQLSRIMSYTYRLENESKKVNIMFRTKHQKAGDTLYTEFGVYAHPLPDDYAFDFKPFEADIVRLCNQDAAETYELFRYKMVGITRVVISQSTCTKNCV